MKKQSVEENPNLLNKMERKLIAIDFYIEHGFSMEEALHMSGITEELFRDYRRKVYGSGSMPDIEFVTDVDEYERIIKARYENCCEAFERLGYGELLEKELLRIYAEANIRVRELFD